MFEQVTLKDKNISEKALHLSLQKIYTHKQGNNHSLDRSEVAGSGKKLFKQKGTGNARAGNKKTTQRRGGGKAFGPKFHDVSFKVNKKVKKKALISSIVSKSNNKALFVFDEEKLDEKNISDLLKKNQNKMIIFVLTNLLDNKLVIGYLHESRPCLSTDLDYINSHQVTGKFCELRNNTPLDQLKSGMGDIFIKLAR